MEEKLKLYRQKYKRHTFIKTAWDFNNRCIIFVEEICLDKYGLICAKGWGVNAIDEFIYGAFGLSGNKVCAATQQEINFWKRLRVKTFFSQRVKILC